MFGGAAFAIVSSIFIFIRLRCQGKCEGVDPREVNEKNLVV